MLINIALQVKQPWLHLIFYVWVKKKDTAELAYNSFYCEIALDEDLYEIQKENRFWQWMWLREGKVITEVPRWPGFDAVQSSHYQSESRSGGWQDPLGAGTRWGDTVVHRQPCVLGCSRLSEPCLVALAGPECGEPSQQERKDTA